MTKKLPSMCALKIASALDLPLSGTCRGQGLFIYFTTGDVMADYIKQVKIEETAILIDGGFYLKRAKVLFGEASPEERANELNRKQRDGGNATRGVKKRRGLFSLQESCGRSVKRPLSLLNPLRTITPVSLFLFTSRAGTASSTSRSRAGRTPCWRSGSATTRP